MTKQKIKAVILAVFFSTLISSCTRTDYVTVNSQYPGDVELWNHTFSKNDPFIIPDKMPSAMVLQKHRKKIQK